jgi:hypothetical protein
MKTDFIIKIIVVGILISIACNLSQNVPKAIPSPTLEYKLFSDAGISINYPNDFIPTENKKTIPEENGLTGLETIIQITSPDKSVGIRIELVEDPTAYIENPNLYPPSDDYLRLSAASAMGSPSISKSQVNETAAKQAYENAIISPISGHHAITYKVLFKDDNFGGDIYMRGSVIITEKRDITVFLLGFPGLSANGSVNSEYIDKLWMNIINSVWIGY